MENLKISFKYCGVWELKKALIINKNYKAKH